MHEMSPVRAVDFNPDGSSILTACGDGGTAHVWSLTSQACTFKTDEQEEVLLSAQFSPDGSSIITGSSDDTAQVWDCLSGASRLQLSGHDGAVYSSCFSSEGS